MTVGVFPRAAEPILAGRLPDWIEPRYFATPEELVDLAVEAEIGWFDTIYVEAIAEATKAAKNLRWLVTVGAGVDFLPLDLLTEKGVMITKGGGVNAAPMAEYIVMGMLTIAKGYREVLNAVERREWLWDSPGKRQLAGSSALIVGFGAVGRELTTRLTPFGVKVTGVRRSAGEGVLGPDEWRARLGEFDWVILAAPATDETRHMIGAAELAAMKPEAVLVNVARGTLIDQPALTQALRDRTIAAAMLDVTDPEPLPPDDPLWSLDNAHITMHLSGRAQTTMFAGVAERLLTNLEIFRRGEVPQPAYDPAKGY